MDVVLLLSMGWGLKSRPFKNKFKLKKKEKKMYGGTKKIEYKYVMFFLC